MASQEPITAPTPRQPSARAIVLNHGLAAVVDETDYPLVCQHHWSAHFRPCGHGYYARSTVNGRKVFMHNLLMGESPGLQVDHANGNGLDNRRCNLRWATGSQNQRNIKGGRGRSLYKGVSWAKRQRKWVANIFVSGRNLHLGYFEQEDDAARAYDAAAREHYGEFAAPNFPSEVADG